jgi:hypothetical protein
LTDWTAFEQVNGPLLVHERIDIGFALIATLMANAWSKRKRKFADFLPPWYEIPKAKTSLTSFEQILEMADADD